MACLLCMQVQAHRPAPLQPTLVVSVRMDSVQAALEMYFDAIVALASRRLTIGDHAFSVTTLRTWNALPYSK